MESSPSHNSPATTLRLADARRLWGFSATNDHANAEVVNPWDVTSWGGGAGAVTLATAFQPTNVADGRLCMLGKISQSIAVWWLSSTAGSTAYLKLWGLDLAPASPISAVAGRLLGGASNIGRVSGSREFAAAVDAAGGEYRRLAFSDNDRPYEVASGTAYYVAGPFVFDHFGFSTLLLTARSVTGTCAALVLPC